MATSRKARAVNPDAADPFAMPPAQGELTPAPAGPAANDEARAAIATISTQLSEFDTVESGLGDLEKRYTKVVYPVDTKKGMDEAVLARREIKGVRVAVEHARKAAKAPVLALGRNIDERAEKISSRLVAIEEPIDDQIKSQEKKEAQRKADLERQITEIRGTPAQCIGKTSAQLQQVLEGLDVLVLDAFAEYREQAAKAQFDAQQQVTVLLQQAKQAEELARLQEEQRREAARRASIEEAISAIGAPLQQLPMCRTSARVQLLIDNVEAVQIADAVYQEFAPAAREKKAAVLAQLIAARDEKKAAEDARAEQDRQAAEPRAAAAAAPTPAPAPSTAPVAMPADEAFTSSALGCLQDPPHIQATAGTTLARPLMPQLVTGVPGPRTVGGDFGRVFGSAPEAPHAALVQSRVVDEDPFTAPEHTELQVDQQRPTDAEILRLVVEHYDTTAAQAAKWLAGFDPETALCQFALPMEA